MTKQLEDRVLKELADDFRRDNFLPLGYYDSAEFSKIHFLDLKRNEEDRLLVSVQRGNKLAKSLAISQYYHYIRNTAEKKKKVYNSDVEVCDLIQVGYIALFKAIKEYKRAKLNGGRFLCYASWKVEQIMDRFIEDHGSNIRIPANVGRRNIEIKRKYELLREYYCKQEALNELTREYKIKEEEIFEALNPNKRYSIREEYDEQDSLNHDGNGGSRLMYETHLGDFVKRESLDEKLEKKLASREILKRAMTGLTKQEKQILTWRFGLHNGNGENGDPNSEYACPIPSKKKVKIRSRDNVERAVGLKEIGKVLNLTKERVRQIEEDAISKMRRKISAVYKGDDMKFINGILSN